VKGAHGDRDGRPGPDGLADADEIRDGNGLAAMLGELLAQNLARDPDRRRLLRRPLRAVIEVPDAGVRASVRADGLGDVAVTAGDDVGAVVRVRAGGMDVLDLAPVPPWGGLPDVRTRDGRAAVRAIASGRIRVRGLLRHLGDVRRLTSLLSAR
jgi:hypothetical protein